MPTFRRLAYARSSVHSRSNRIWSAIAAGPANRAHSPSQYGCRATKDSNSSGGPSGSTCHHDCPAASSQSTNAYASAPSLPPGSEVGCRKTPDERAIVTRATLTRASVPLGARTEPGGELLRQLSRLEPPPPVAVRTARIVHARLAPQPEHVLRLHERERRPRRIRGVDQPPVRLVRGEPGRRPDLVGDGLVPPARGVHVVGRRVDDLPLAVVLEAVGIRRSAVVAEDHHHHARDAQLVAERVHLLGHLAEVLGDELQRPEHVLHRTEELAAGSRTPAAALRGLPPGRHRPVRDERAEVVDPRHVDELERPPEALRPPAVALDAMRPPVVDRVPPELARRAEVVGRRTRYDLLLEQLPVCALVGAAGGDVDRQVAEDADAVRLRVRAKPRPLALEA